MDLVHDEGSMDPVHESGLLTRSKVADGGPLVHVLSSPDHRTICYDPQSVARLGGCNGLVTLQGALCSLESLD